MNDVLWYLARAGGLTAYALLTASVALGLVTSLRVASPRWPRAVIADLHRFLTVTALTFCGIHLAAIVLDGAAGVRLVEALVPFASDWEPLGMALGVVGLELAVAIALSTRVRARIGYRAWRRLHYASFAVFGAALVHGLLTGTDTGATPVAFMYAASLALVAGLVLARVLASRDAARPARSAPAAPATPAPRRTASAAALPPLTPRRRASAGLPPLG